jgi:hypothetical protein
MATNRRRSVLLGTTDATCVKRAPMVLRCVLREYAQTLEMVFAEKQHRLRRSLLNVNKRICRAFGAVS